MVMKIVNMIERPDQAQEKSVSVGISIPTLCLCQESFMDS